MPLVQNTTWHFQHTKRWTYPFDAFLFHLKVSICFSSVGGAHISRCNLCWQMNLDWMWHLHIKEGLNRYTSLSPLKNVVLVQGQLEQGRQVIDYLKEAISSFWIWQHPKYSVLIGLDRPSVVNDWQEDECWKHWEKLYDVVSQTLKITYRVIVMMGTTTNPDNSEVYDII